MNTTRQQKHNWSYSCKQDIPGTRLLQQQDFRSVDHRYRLLQAVRTQGEAALQDGRHGHPAKLREAEAFEWLQAFCRSAPQIPSREVQGALQERSGIHVSIGHLNRSVGGIGHWDLCWALEKKQQTLCSPLEAQWQEGAGGLLLVAAAQETGLLPALETALASCTPQDHSRLAHLSPLSGRMLMLTFLSLGVVGLRRTWDLRSYTGDALGLLSGRKRAYGYLHTERLLSEVARAQGDEVFTDALARWTAQLWQMPELEPGSQPASFYVDGHRKPVYTGALIPRGLVGRLSTNWMPGTCPVT